MPGPSDTLTSSTATMPLPIIIDLGEQPRKRVRRLRRGEGRLMEQIQECLRELKAAGKLTGTAQPVVVIVEEEPEGFFDF